MAYSSPLLSDHRGASTTPTSSPRKGWSTTISSKLSGKDDMTISIEKATRSDTGGRPKEKHLAYILADIEANPLEADSILLKLNALTEWSDTVVATGKVLIILHEIIIKLRPNNDINFENFIIFLNEIRNFYKDQNIPLIDRHTMGLIGHIRMKNEFRELSSIVFSDSFAYAFSKSKIINVDVSLLILFITRLLSYQDNLISVLATDAYATASTAPLSTINMQTFQEIQFLCRKDSKTIQRTLSLLLSHAEQQHGKNSHGLEYLREQYESQIRLL